MSFQVWLLNSDFINALCISIPDGELICLVSPLNPLNETTAAKYIRHIAEGLQYLHDQGFIHANLSVRLLCQD